MIGVSLKYSDGIFTEEYKASLRPTLEKMRLAGVESVELRTVCAGSDPEKVLEAARFFAEEGFQITVHGQILSPQTAIEDVFAPLSLLLKDLGQKKLTVTVHPLVCDNAALLVSLSDHILDNGLPVVIALENGRLMPDGTEGDCAALVLDAVSKADRDNVGICFDMGHYQYYLRTNHPDEPDLLPEDGFFKRVVHTHVHALKGSRTHFPLGRYPLPLERYAAKLCGYYGVYDLELIFGRFKNEIGAEEAILESVAELKARLPRFVAEYDAARLHFDSWAKSALTVKDHSDGLYFGLIQSTSYLFNTRGYFWAMDVAFRAARFLSDMPAKADEWLKDLKLMIISHSHSDHFEKPTVSLLAHLPLLWVIPDFLTEKAISLGVDPEKIITARAGERIKVGPLDILPFQGQHFRPATDVGIEELGYIVSSEGLPTLAFPGDVRDTSTDRLTDIPKSDFVFGHVWLGDHLALLDKHPVAADMARFLLKFSDKNVFLTHLHENGREDVSLWLECHAEELAKEIRALSPSVKTRIPDRGEVIRLDKEC